MTYQTKLYVDILMQLPLTKVEEKLLAVNVELVNNKLRIIKKIGIVGIHDLLFQVNFRLSLYNISRQHINSVEDLIIVHNGNKILHRKRGQRV